MSYVGECLNCGEGYVEPVEPTGKMSRLFCPTCRSADAETAVARNRAATWNRASRAESVGDVEILTKGRRP